MNDPNPKEVELATPESKEKSIEDVFTEVNKFDAKGDKLKAFFVQRKSGVEPMAHVGTGTLPNGMEVGIFESPVLNEEGKTVEIATRYIPLKEAMKFDAEYAEAQTASAEKEPVSHEVAQDLSETASEAMSIEAGVAPDQLTYEEATTFLEKGEAPIETPAKAVTIANLGALMDNETQAPIVDQVPQKNILEGMADDSTLNAIEAQKRIEHSEAAVEHKAEGPKNEEIQGLVNMVIHTQQRTEAIMRDTPTFEVQRRRIQEAVHGDYEHAKGQLERQELSKDAYAIKLANLLGACPDKRLASEIMSGIGESGVLSAEEVEAVSRMSHKMDQVVRAQEVPLPAEAARLAHNIKASAREAGGYESAQTEYSLVLDSLAAGFIAFGGNRVDTGAVVGDSYSRLFAAKK